MKFIFAIIPLCFLCACLCPDRKQSQDLSQEELFNQLYDVINNGDQNTFCEIIGKFKDYERKADGGDTLMHRIVICNRVSMLAEILRKNISTELHDKDFFTPLHIAARFGHVEQIRLLIKAGAKIDAITPGYDTALILACQFGQLDAVKALVEHGADVNWHSDDSSGTPLSSARRFKHKEIEEYLMAHGATAE